MSNITLDLSNEERFETNTFTIDKNITFIFGKNGTGKTTLTNLLKDNATDYEVSVFQGFETVVSESNMLDAVILGKDNVEIDKKIAEKNAEIEKIKSDVERIEKNISEQPDDPNNLWARYEEKKTEYNNQKDKLDKFFRTAASKIKKENDPTIADTNYDKNCFEKEISIATEQSEDTINMDRTMLRIGAMNMMTHGIANPNIAYKDSLSEQNTDSGKYTKILANPPFKGSLNYEGVSTDLLKVAKTKKTELLFLILFLRMLKTGGRCASIVPDGVLFGSSNAHKAIRKEIVENNRLEAIISMPSGVFKPYAGVSTAVIIFTKTGAGGTDDVWFYDMQNDGYSLDDKRTAIAGSDIPDIVARFKSLGEEAKRERTEQSFLVPKAEIVANGYDLSINKYKKTVYVEETYPHPLEIMTEIRQLESEITSGLAELEAMLRG